MNGTHGLPVDDKTLDRLVDGELDQQEYETVLRSLDQSPGQWRRCALAFLESQAWGGELRAIRRDAGPPRTAEVCPRPQRWSRHWPLLLAVAASFLVAFGLGLLFRPFSPAGASSSTPQIAESAVPPNAPSSGAGAVSTAPTLRTPDGNVIVMMNVGDGLGTHPVSVPVVDWSPQNEGMLRRGPTNIPSEVRRALQQMGYELRLNKQLMRSETADGRPVLIPVEQFEMVPVGRRAYQ